MIDPKISGKVALVTGANHGIGSAIALALARQDVSIFLAYYRPDSDTSPAELAETRERGVGGPELYEASQLQDGNEVVEAIRRIGGTAVAYEADLSGVGAVENMFTVCQETLGGVDILVNNHTHCVLETFDPARVSTDGFHVRLPTADSIDRHFQVNARAYALAMVEYVKQFRRRRAEWGRIVNISTDAAHAHVANVSYAASKHAIESYSRSAAAELGGYGITVNVVAPGAVQTGYIDPELEKEIEAGTPLGRVGAPEDIADVVVFLASEQARWVTGQLIYVGGGWRMPQ